MQDPSPQLKAGYLISFIAVTLAAFSFYLYYIPKQIESANGKVISVYDAKRTDTIRIASQDKITVDTIFVDSIFNLPKIDKSRLFMAENPRFMAWYFTICMLNGFSISLIFLFGFLTWKNIKNQGPFKWLWLGIPFISVGFYLFLLNPQGSDISPLVYSEVMREFSILFKGNAQHVVKWINFPGEVCGLVALIGITSLAFRAERSHKNMPLTGWQSVQTDLLSIKNQFTNYIYTISGLILVGILATSFLNEVIISQLGNDFDYLSPKSFLWGYGLRYTCILMFFYFPVYYYLRLIAADVKAATINAEGSTTELDGAFGASTLRGIFWDRFKIISAALAPLIGTAGAELIKTLQGFFP